MGKRGYQILYLDLKEKNPDLHKTQSRTAETHRRQNSWLISLDLSPTTTQIGLIHSRHKTTDSGISGL
jgi:hypothetical protein